MPSTILPPTESTAAPADTEPRPRPRPRRRPLLAGAVAAIAAPALLIAGWAAAPAGAQDEPPDPASNPADISYEQCVEAALTALDPVEEATSDATAPNAGTGDPVDPVKSQHAGATSGATIPDPADDEQVHPNSPAHEMCTETCPEDQQCPRPTEFTVVRDDNVETISFENPQPEGDPAD